MTSTTARPPLRCECGKGFKIRIQYGDSAPVPTCSWTVLEYERRFGKSTSRIVR